MRLPLTLQLLESRPELELRRGPTGVVADRLADNATDYSARLKNEMNFLSHSWIFHYRRLLVGHMQSAYGRAFGVVVVVSLHWRNGGKCSSSSTSRPMRPKMDSIAAQIDHDQQVTTDQPNERTNDDDI